MIASGHDPLLAADHPSPLRLAAFGMGKLGEGESSAIVGHIADCRACRSLVEAAGDDSLAGLFREAVDRGSMGGPAVGPPAGRFEAGAPSGYDVLEVIGEGGMGVVSKARQVGLGRLVALKQIRPGLMAGWEDVERFRREAGAAARLRHPNIVPIYDVGWRSGVPYYSMEYVEGGTLRDRLASGPVDPRLAARAVEALARAVQHAHESGIIHRDLKPANVLLAPDLDCPKITDFGLAKQDDDAMQTRPGVVIGTPGYMAPEQAAGDPSRVGPSADVFALGAILYECLTGRPPFRAPSSLETLELLRFADPVAPRQVRGRVPRDLETIALKCLEKSPARRYASALGLAEDLRRHLEGEPIAARPASKAERLAKWARRRPWQATSAALGVVVLIGSMAGLLAHDARLRVEVRKTEREAEEAKAQKARAEGQYRSARDAIRKMVGRLDEPRFAGRPVDGRLGVRRQLREDALGFFEEAVRDDGPSDLSARVDKVLALRDAGHFQSVLHQREAAGRSLRRALGLLDALVSDGRGDPLLFALRVDCLNRLGLNLVESGRPEEARPEFLRAIELADRASRDDPGSVERGDDLARGHVHLALALADPVEAEPHLVEAASIRRRLLDAHPDDFELRARVAEGLVDLALIRSRLGKPDLADSGYAEAERDLAPVVRDHPGLQFQAISLGKLYLNWGSLAMSTGRVDLAIDRYKAGGRVVDRVLEGAADWPDARLESGRLAAALAYTLTVTGRPREAIAPWDRAIALGDGTERRNYRILRGACLARVGRGAEAIAEAEAIASVTDPPPSALDLYNLACVASVVAGTAGSTGLAESAASESLRWLARADALGAFRGPGLITGLDHDRDFDPIRGRRDFQLFRLDLSFPVDPFAATR